MTGNGGTIPPIRMVMTGGWFMALFYPHEFRRFPRSFGIGSHCFDLSMLVVRCLFPTLDGEGIPVAISTLELVNLCIV